MPRLRRTPVLCLIPVFAFLLAIAAPIRASEFVGDLAMNSRLFRLPGRITVKDSIYRMDVVQRNVPSYVIVNELVDSSYLVSPRTGSYRAVSTKSPHSLQNDAIQAFRHGSILGVKEFLGVDSVQGLACDHFVVKISNTPIMSAWVATDLGFPIRILNLMSPDSAYVEVTNIAVGPVDEELFSIPDDFKRVEESPAAGADPSAGVKEGQGTRRPVSPKMPVEIALVNVNEGESECVIDFLFQGKPLPESDIGPVSARTFRFSALGEQTHKIYDVGADQVLVGVVKGEVAVDIMQPEASGN